MATDIASIYAASLRSTHALETQGLQQIEGQLSGLEHYPEYAALLRDHLGTVRAQIARIEAVLGELGEGTSAIKETVTNIAGRIGAAVHALASDETLKNLFAGYGYQYDQVAAYRSLAVIAEEAGHSDHAAGWREAAAEERRAAEAVDEIIETVTRRYLARALAGAKADS